MHEGLRFDLERFVSAQTPMIEQALAELRQGRKRSHWMWFIFPQIAGLGRSATAQYYAIASLDEARAFLDHPVLGSRLKQCTLAVLNVKNRGAHDIFSSPDDLKFHSSMTLFAEAAPHEPLFRAALDKYFGGAGDPLTVQKLR
jgi:uncharacterized protein (DUF1810 family)